VGDFANKAGIYLQTDTPLNETAKASVSAARAD